MTFSLSLYFLSLHNNLNLGITDFTVTKARTAVITFSEALIEYYHSVFIKRPNEGVHLTAFTDPLRNYSWAMITVFLGVCPVLLFLSVR